MNKQQEQDMMLHIATNCEHMTVAEKNVEIVKWKRVVLVTKSLPADVRKALDEAVKNGKLKKMNKDGRFPQAYYHPEFGYLAERKRVEYATEQVEALKKVMA